MTRRRPTFASAAVLAAAFAGLTACSEVADRPLPPSGPDAGVHPAGWLTEGSDGFHGAAIKAANWDLSTCQSCHGADYAGGWTEASCLTCHAQTPESCTTCHGTAGVSAAPPEGLDEGTDPTSLGVGAHQAHLTTAIAEPLGCSDCHVFRGFDDPAHIDASTPGRAEVNFGERAGADAAYDPTGGSCAATCHAGGRFGLDRPVAWTDVGTGAAACGTCHALPPAPDTGHPSVPESLRCSACHPSVVDAELNIIAPELHINGRTDQ